MKPPSEDQQQSPAKENHNAGVDDQASVDDSGIDYSNVSESKPPPDLSVRGIMSSMRLRQEDREKMQFIQTLPLKEQVIELKELVYDRSEAALYFKNECAERRRGRRLET